MSHLMRLWYFSSSVNLFFKNMLPSSGPRYLIFGRTLRLLPYFMWANSEGSGETARMRRLAWAFARRLCDKYHNLMSWLNYKIDFDVHFLACTPTKGWSQLSITSSVLTFWRPRFLSWLRYCLRTDKASARSCHNRKPQPTPGTKRKSKKTESNACEINTHINTHMHVSQGTGK